MVQCILFDMDGTLVDSNKLWFGIAADFIKSQGLPPENNLYDTLYGKTIEYMGSYIKNNYSIDMTAEQIAQAIFETVVKKYEFAEEKAGALAFVKAVHERGIKTAVVSACPEEIVCPTLEKLGFTKYLDAVFYRTSKSTPEAFFELSEKFSFDIDNTWIFEDNLPALIAAKKAGLKAAAIHEPTNKTPVEEFIANSDRFYKDFSDLDQILNDVL